MADNKMQEDQIRNGKSRNGKSGTPTYRIVLSDRIAKPRIVIHGTPNLEKYLRTMWTAPLKKKYNGSACGNNKRKYKARGNYKSARKRKPTMMLFKMLFITSNGSSIMEFVVEG